jgi:hypothetical protein
MKVYDCQEELKQAYNSNDNFIVTYRTIYEIKHSHGVGEESNDIEYRHSQNECDYILNVVTTIEVNF